VTQVTGVGYNASGLVLCNNEVVRDGSHPSFSKLMEVLILTVVYYFLLLFFNTPKCQHVIA